MDLVPVGNSPRVSFPVLKIVSSIRFAAISRASVCTRVCVCALDKKYKHSYIENIRWCGSLWARCSREQLINSFSKWFKTCWKKYELDNFDERIFHSIWFLYFDLSMGIQVSKQFENDVREISVNWAENYKMRAM